MRLKPMRIIKRCLSAVLICLMLAGCSGSDSSGENTASGSSSPEQQSRSSEENKQTDQNDTGSVVPVLAIETVSKESTAMDFITKPINRFVAKSMASWTPGFKIPAEPYYEACTVKLTNTDGSVLLDNASAQVKVRGNWTTKNPKKPLRIKFDEKQSMLTLNDGAKMKNWLLLAEYKDLSMLRNKTALQIAREMYKDSGLYAADCEFVEVTVNGEYWGMYLLTEQQQINSDRVNITKAEEGYKGTDIGYFLEFDGYYKLEDKLNAFLVNYHKNDELIPFDGNDGSGRTIAALKDKGQSRREIVGITIKSDIYSQEQHDFISSFVNNAYDIMYEAAYNKKAFVFNDSFTEISETNSITPEEAVRKAVDVDSLADAYILAELCCDADLYWSSFFMDADFGENGAKKLVFEAPWDFDSAFGNKDRCASAEGFYAANILWDVNDAYQSVNPWIAVLMYEDWFQNIIREHWTAAYDSGIFTRASEMIEKDSTDLEAVFERNHNRWDTIYNNEDAGEWCAGAAACKSEKEAADYLNSWLKTRVDFLNNYWHK